MFRLARRRCSVASPSPGFWSRSWCGGAAHLARALKGSGAHGRARTLLVKKRETGMISGILPSHHERKKKKSQKVRVCMHVPPACRMAEQALQSGLTIAEWPWIRRGSFAALAPATATLGIAADYTRCSRVVPAVRARLNPGAFSPALSHNRASQDAGVFHIHGYHLLELYRVLASVTACGRERESLA